MNEYLIVVESKGLTWCKAWEPVKSYCSVPFDELIWCHLSIVIDAEF